jgi:Fe-S-cluster containining protein
MGEQHQETVSIDFTVGIGDGKFSATAVVPAGHTNLTQILPVIQALEDSLIAGVGAQLSQADHSISCKAGCGACCRQMVPLSIFEAEALSAWIRTLPEARQQELAGRFHQALVRLSASGLIDRMVNEDWLATTPSASQLATEYLYQRVACPFLEDESCSIHSIRPLVCREYLVTSPPEHCYDPANLPTVLVRLPLNFSRILNTIGAELEQSIRCWIPLVFLFAWMKGDAHPGERMAGDGPQVLYEFVKRISAAALPEPYAEPSEEE